MLRRFPQAIFVTAFDGAPGIGLLARCNPLFETGEFGRDLCKAVYQLVHAMTAIQAPHRQPGQRTRHNESKQSPFLK
jgi:hypothetical protein